MAVEINSSLIGKVLDFETYAAPILGSKIKGAKLLSILDPGTVKELGFDITSKHAQVYPYLDGSTPDSPLKYNYLKFLLSDGSTTYLGVPWIKADSITTVEVTNITVVIKGRNQDAINQVKKALVANGFEDFTIEVTS